jgi:hypothetical protein
VRPARLAWRKSKLKPAWAYVDSWNLGWQLLVVLLRIVYLVGCSAVAARTARGQPIGECA